MGSGKGPFYLKELNKGFKDKEKERRTEKELEFIAK